MAPRNSNDENPRRARLGPSESLRSLGAAGGIFLTLPFHVPPLRIMFLMFGRRGGFCWEKADFRARRAEKVHDSSRTGRPATAARILNTAARLRCGPNDPTPKVARQARRRSSNHRPGDPAAARGITHRSRERTPFGAWTALCRRCGSPRTGPGHYAARSFFFNLKGELYAK